MRNCLVIVSLTLAIAIAQGSADLGASPLLANLTAAQITQYAAAHVAQQQQQQLQQRSSAFSPVQQTDPPAGFQATASLAVSPPSGRTYFRIDARLQLRSSGVNLQATALGVCCVGVR